jgi:hypothetical protein
MHVWALVGIQAELVRLIARYGKGSGVGWGKGTYYFLFVNGAEIFWLHLRDDRKIGVHSTPYRKEAA